MKLSIKSAILCGTGVFLIATYTSMLSSLSPDTLKMIVQNPEFIKDVLDPMKILSVALPGAAIAGSIGYLLGDILSKPKGAAKKNVRKQSTTFEESEELSLATNETFLDDIEPLNEASGDSAPDELLES